ncbi:MAG: IPT/TIG domain-containing protein, partial [Bryobacteraceae bacterium]
LSAIEFVGSQEIDLTLGGATDLDGKDVSIVNGDGSRANYICSLPVGVAVSNPPANVYPIFPWETYQGGFVGIDYPSTVVFVIQNQNPTPVDMTFTEIQPFPMGEVIQTGDVTIPAGGYYVSPGFGALEEATRQVQIVSTAPVRMLQLTTLPPDFSGTESTTVTPSLMTPQDPASPLSTTSVMFFSWQAGTAAPSAQQLVVNANAASTSFTASPSTASGGSWLQVTPAQGTEATTLSVSVNPTGLAPGSYQGTISLTPTGAYVAPTTVSVSLQVTAQPFLELTPSELSSQCCSLQPYGMLAQPALGLSAKYGQTASATLQIVTNGNPAAFSASAVTFDGGRIHRSAWLTVTPSQGSTPAAITVTLNAAETSGFQQGQIVVKGSNNSIVLPFYAQIVGGPSVPPALAPSPPSVTFGYRVGDPTPAAQQVMWSSTNLAKAVVSASASTQSGGDWLNPVLIPGEDTYAWINVNPAGLPPGTYSGLVTFTATGAAPGLLPVTLIVWSTAPPLAVTPTSLLLVVASDGPAANPVLTLTSGETPLPVTVTTKTSDGGNWLGADTSPFPNFEPVTPAELNVGAGASGMLPGIYHGSVTLTAASGSVVVPVTLLVEAGPYSSPIIGSIVAATSRIQRGVSAGAIVTIYGIGMGELGATSERGSNGTFPTEIDHTQVLFDGVPAQILFASVSQINVITPPEVANRNVTNIQVEYNGSPSAVWAVPVVPPSPPAGKP